VNRLLALPVLTLVFLMVGGAIGAHLRATRPPAPPPAPAAVTPVRPAADLQDAALVVRHRGQKQLALSAERVSVSPDLRYATFAGIAQVVLYQDGQVALRLSAAGITLDRQSNNLVVRGPLEITAEDGYRLRAPRAAWDAERRTLTFPGGIEMATAGATIRAGRLTVDVSSRSLLLDGGVDIAFTVAGGGP